MCCLMSAETKCLCRNVYVSLFDCILEEVVLKLFIYALTVTMLVRLSSIRMHDRNLNLKAMVLKFVIL